MYLQFQIVSSEKILFQNWNFEVSYQISRVWIKRARSVINNNIPLLMMTGTKELWYIRAKLIYIEVLCGARSKICYNDEVCEQTEAMDNGSARLDDLCFKISLDLFIFLTLQRAVRDVRAVTPPLCVTTVPAGTPWWTARLQARECVPVSTRRPFSRRTTTRLPTGQEGVPKWTSLNRSRKQDKGLVLGSPFGRGLESGEGSQHCKQNGALLWMGQGVPKWTSSNRFTYWFKVAFWPNILELSCQNVKDNCRRGEIKPTQKNSENWNFEIL